MGKTMMLDLVKNMYGNRYKVYPSKYLYWDSVVMENSKIRYEFYIKENDIMDNELWLFMNYEKLPKRDEGGGYGEKVGDLREQIKEFVKEDDKETTQLSMFDML